MITLTSHIPPKLRGVVGEWSLSDRAENGIRACLEGQGVTDIDGVWPVVARSLASFLTGEYMTNSDWFKRQPKHTFVVLQLTTDNPPKAVAMSWDEQIRLEAPVLCVPLADKKVAIVAVCDMHEHVVRSIDEAGNPTEYFDERVLAEVWEDYFVTR